MNTVEQNDTDDNLPVVCIHEKAAAPMNDFEKQISADYPPVVKDEETSDDDEKNNDLSSVSLEAPNSRGRDKKGGVVDNTGKNRTDVAPYKEHVREVTNLTVPVILAMFFQNTMPIIDIAFVGNIGKNELAAAALATVWFNLWNATMMGFMTAIATYLSQSYGAQNYYGYGVWAGNSLVIIFLCTILVAAVVSVCGPMMKLFGQDHDVADAAGDFSYSLIPGLFPYYLFLVIVEILQAQDRLAAGVVVGIVANGVNIFLNWWFIFYLDLGLTGAPWATTITRYAQFIVIVAYLIWNKASFEQTVKTGSTTASDMTSRGDQSSAVSGRGGDINMTIEGTVQSNDYDMDTIVVSTWPQFDRTYMTREVLGPFWKLGISGALSFSAETWSFEITTILAGLLGTIDLDAHVITLSLATFIYLSFPYAIGVAASIRVGQLIGEQRPEDACRSYHTSVGLAFISQCILIAILWPGRYIIAGWFSIDAEVSQLVAELIPISCIFMMADTVQAVIGGVLRGVGHQQMVLYLNILAYWVLAVPIGAALTFLTSLGVKGLWWGFVIGLYLAAVISFVYVKLRINWKGEAEVALKRVSTVSMIRPSTPVVDSDMENAMRDDDLNSYVRE
jgi:MATE family multidrug resistance protein